MTEHAHLLLLLMTAAACFFLMRRTSRRLAKARSLDETPITGRRTSETVLRSKTDGGRRQVEVYDWIRDVQGELDSKMRVLQLLVGQARREAERLENLLRQAERTDEFGADDASHPSFPERSRTPEQTQEVYRLAEQGGTAAEIAERLGRPLGEIELILSLRRRN